MSRTPVGRLMSPFNATIAPRKLDQAVKVQSDRNPDQIPRLQRWVALGWNNNGPNFDPKEVSARWLSDDKVISGGPADTGWLGNRVPQSIHFPDHYRIAGPGTFADHIWMLIPSWGVPQYLENFHNYWWTISTQVAREGPLGTRALRKFANPRKSAQDQIAKMFCKIIQGLLFWSFFNIYGRETSSTAQPSPC